MSENSFNLNLEVISNISDLNTPKVVMMNMLKDLAKLGYVVKVIGSSDVECDKECAKEDAEISPIYPKTEYSLATVYDEEVPTYISQHNYFDENPRGYQDPRGYIEVEAGTDGIQHNSDTLSFLRIESYMMDIRYKFVKSKRGIEIRMKGRPALEALTEALKSILRILESLKFNKIKEGTYNE